MLLAAGAVHAAGLAGLIALLAVAPWVGGVAVLAVLSGSVIAPLTAAESLLIDRRARRRRVMAGGDPRRLRGDRDGTLVALARRRTLRPAVASA